MNEKSDHLKSVLNFLEGANTIEIDLGMPSLTPSDILASIFSPGPFYYFIVNFFDLRIEYVHPTIEHILGCKPDDFTLNLLFERMHPEDAPKMVLKEKATGEFFYNRLPPTKLMHYKSSYTFRLEDYQGNWKTILHQCNPIQVSRQGKIHHSLSVHTDVTHLNIPSDDRVSFIGMYGEPSFYSLSTDPETILEPAHTWSLTSREKEIVHLLAEGYASKQIADYLFISTHTVDTHRRNLLKKTGTKNTLELTVACVKKGLL